jgi:hypothetical protein
MRRFCEDETLASFNSVATAIADLTPIRPIQCLRGLRRRTLCVLKLTAVRGAPTSVNQRVVGSSSTSGAK